VPIKISSEKAGDMLRRIKAEARVDGVTKRVGTMFVKSPKIGPLAHVQQATVHEAARGSGIKKEMFSYASSLFGRAGKKLVGKKK
jgi:hypothetical protein